MFVKAKKPKNLRPKLALAHLEDDEDEPEMLQKIAPKHKPINPINNNQQFSSGSKKLKQVIKLNNSATAPVSRLYNDEVLAALKAKQRQKPAVVYLTEDDKNIEETFVPNEAQILKMKHERSLKIDREVNMDFIALDSDRQVSTNVKESRLVTEDQIDEQTFDDYNDQILFGPDAIKNATRLKMKEIEEAQNEMNDFRNGTEEEWELQMIHRGIDERHLADDEVIKPVVIENELVPMPNLIESVNMDDILDKLNQTVMEFTNHNENNKEQLNYAANDVSLTKDTISKLVDDIKQSSLRYEFFQNLKVFCTDFQDFLEVKFPIVERMELDVTKISIDSANERWRIKWNVLDTHFLQFMGIPMTFENDDYISNYNANISSISNSDMDLDKPTLTATELKNSINDIFEDVSNEYKDLAKVKQNFEAWKTIYTTEYNQSYASLTLNGAFAIYIRTELIEWR
jgi:hypothetical protein